MASYEQLCASPLYRSEDAMNRVRSKLPPKQVETKENLATPNLTNQQQEEALERINAEFSQWLKDNSAKPTRE
ncbi:MAG: hypothetical protein E7016_07085 [Alphaproteobacteria bacterium]|nr:hypothetical protein [Alphaproteobacteria bacterium]